MTHTRGRRAADAHVSCCPFIKKETGRQKMLVFCLKLHWLNSKCMETQGSGFFRTPSRSDRSAISLCFPSLTHYQSYTWPQVHLGLIHRMSYHYAHSTFRMFVVWLQPDEYASTFTAACNTHNTRNMCLCATEKAEKCNAKISIAFFLHICHLKI